jgi:hypothetical protein
MLVPADCQQRALLPCLVIFSPPPPSLPPCSSVGGGGVRLIRMQQDAELEYCRQAFCVYEM